MLLRKQTQASAEGVVLLIVVVLVFGTSWVYRAINKDWVAFRQGISAINKGDYERGLERLETAQTAGLEHPQLQIRLGEAYLALDRLDDARSVFTSLIREDPSDAAAVSTLAGIYQTRDEPARALHVFLDGRDAGAVFDPREELQMAGLFAQLQLTPEAMELYRDLSANPETELVARIRLAELYAWNRDYGESVKLLSAVIAQDPNNRAARLLLARVLSWDGRRPESIAEYQRLLE